MEVTKEQYAADKKFVKDYIVKAKQGIISYEIAKVATSGALDRINAYRQLKSKQLGSNKTQKQTFTDLMRNTAGLDF